MHVHLLKSKLHRVTLTQCELEYEGSLSMDRDLMDKVGILPNERILVVNQTNGERLETYAIPVERGSRQFCLNGAAARRGQPGDMITIMAFGVVDADEAGTFKPRIAVLGPDNKVKDFRD